jgi:hypothetical protein
VQNIWMYYQERKMGNKLKVRNKTEHVNCSVSVASIFVLWFSSWLNLVVQCNILSLCFTQNQSLDDRLGFHHKPYCVKI